MKDKTKLLIAIRPKALPRLTNVLGAEFSLIFCHTMRDVFTELDDEVEAIICGTNFDESRMFELLQQVKANLSTRNLPVICIKVFEGVLHEGSNAGVAKAAELLGASTYIDFARWRVEFGKVEAAERLRAVLREVTDQKIRAS